ncbi:DUF6221 family protein [Streptomyces sp. NPDC096153]|uniref:DUF6221 family protein n=1 Tax=Streptomyces sp. NPDC096153 TaxID=3155548 RepID=UPI003323D0D5
MGDLAAWTAEQIAAREAAARAATPGPWWYNPGKQWLDADAFERYDLSEGQEFVGYGGPHPFTGAVAATGRAGHVQSMADAAHIALHHPEAVLRRCAADRALLDRHTPHTSGSTDCAIRCERAHWGLLVCNHDGRSWPCLDVTDLAATYGHTPETST